MKTRFSAEWKTIKKDLVRTARRVGYQKVQILRKKNSPEALVKLVNGSSIRKIRCQTFPHHEDNVRAIGLSLEYQRRIRDEYGAELVRESARAVEPDRRLSDGSV